MKARDPEPARRPRQEIHFGCAHTRAPRRTWCLAARGPGLGPRTSRAAHTVACGSGVHGHTRSGSLRHGRSVRDATVPGKRLRDKPSASTEAVSRQIVKEPPISRRRGPTIAGRRRCACRMKNENAKQKTKRPGSSSGPGLCEESWKVRLRASLPRVHSILMSLERQIADCKQQRRRRAARAPRLHRQGMRESNPSLCGAGCCHHAVRFHDAAVLKSLG
jgi:hypothetical protein